MLPPATLCAVTCDVPCCHLRRKSATRDKKCRRSGEYCRHATFPSVTCDALRCYLRRSILSPAAQIGHRGQKVSQVRRILQTCDALRCHLRHFLLSPAMSRAATCDSSFCHLGRLITADGESEAAFHHETEGMDGKTIDVCPANTGKIVAYGRIEIDAQPGSDHELCTGAYACRPLE